jgi:hypothetical protein
MANLTEDEIGKMVDDAVREVTEKMAEAVAKERERCALLAEALAFVWERSARKMRERGTYTTRALWPPLKKMTFVAPAFERAAKDIESAAKGLRDAVVVGIRAGWKPLPEFAEPAETDKADFGNVGTEAGS